MTRQSILQLFFLLSLTGCTALTGKSSSAMPQILQGSNSEIRQNLLEAIPLGTSRDEALRIARSLGLEPQPELDSGSNQPIRCNYTKSEYTSTTTWLVQIDCPQGQVTDVFCESIGTD